MKCDIRSREVDNGYGWVVVTMCFLIQVIADGVHYSFGILMVELLEEFDNGRSRVSTIGSLLTGMLCCTGPFAAVLCDKYGCRVVVITGSIISCAGLVISSFATGITYLYISCGIFTGFGLGLMYLPTNVCVVWYFEKYRGLANGITVSGAGVGAFVFNNLGRYLIDLYGWRGLVLLQGSICLQCTVFGLMLVQPVWIKSMPPINKGAKKQPDISALESEGGDIVVNVIGIQNPTLIKNEGETSVSMTTNGSAEELHNTCHNEPRKSQTFDSINIEEKDNETFKRRDKNERNERMCEQLFRSLRNYIYNDGLLMDKRYWAMLLSTFVIFLSFFIPNNFTADHAIENGMSKSEAAWLTSTMGITGAAGRVLFGLLGDQSCVNRSVLLGFGHILAGILTGVSVFVVTFTGRMFYTCLYGLFTGGFFSLIAVVIAETFGTERVAKGFGFIMFTVGVGATVSLPMAGFFYDQTGNYDVTFIVAGSEQVVGAVIFIIPVCFWKK